MYVRKICYVDIVIAAADGDSSSYWLQIRWILLGIHSKYQLTAHVHIQIDRRSRSNVNQYGDRSICKGALPASRNLISANGERCSSLRRATSVLSKRSDVPQRTFRPSHRPACDAMTMSPILFYISRPTYDRHAADLSRLV